MPHREIIRITTITLIAELGNGSIYDGHYKTIILVRQTPDNEYICEQCFGTIYRCNYRWPTRIRVAFGDILVIIGDLNFKIGTVSIRFLSC